MNREQAIRLVEKALNAFDRETVLHFIRNVLNHSDESKKQRMQVPHAFTQHVRSCQRFATYTAPEGELLDILVVRLTADYKIERTRTALRDFVAHKLKRGNNQDALIKVRVCILRYIPSRGEDIRCSGFLSRT